MSDPNGGYGTINSNLAASYTSNSEISSSNPYQIKWKFNMPFPHMFNLYLSIDNFIPVKSQVQLLEVIRCCGEFRYQSQSGRKSSSAAARAAVQGGGDTNTFLDYIEQESVYPKVMLE